MIVGIPLMQLLLFGYAINFDVRHLAPGVADLAGTSRSRACSCRTCRRRGWWRSCASAQRASASCEGLLREGEISMGIYVPPDFERRGWTAIAAAQLLVDGSDRRSRLARARGDCRLPCARAAGIAGAAPDTFEVRTYYNPERRTAVQIVPGADGRDPDHDHGAVHRGGDRARARARQPRAADHDAGQPARADGRQAPAVRGHRPDPDHAGAAARRGCCSTCRCAAASSPSTSRPWCSSRPRSPSA